MNNNTHKNDAVIQICHLGELCTDVIDCPHSTPKWLNNGVRVIRNFNIRDGRLDFSNGFYVDEETYASRIHRGSPEAGDIVISREAPMGVAALIPEGLRCCLGQRLVLLKVDQTKCDPRYLLFVLMSEYAQTQFHRADATGSTVSNLTIPDLKDICIPIIENQRNAGSFLWQMSSAIEQNKQIIDNLLATAKSIYDYWFTQYDYPDENGNPYRSSGGEMKLCKQLNQAIPVGWDVSRLGDICTLSLGGTPDTSIPEYWNGSICWLNSGEVAQFPVLSSELTITLQGLDHSSAKIMPAGTVVISITGNIRASILGIESSANQSVVGIYETDLLKSSYIYPLINNKLKRYTIMATGNCQKHINKGIINDAIIVIPPKEILMRYYSSCTVLYEEMLSRAKENLTLRALRDWLLPMLMNGQATVDSMEPNSLLADC